MRKGCAAFGAGLRRALQQRAFEQRLGYITPKDMLSGHQQEIQAERYRKLDAARQHRRADTRQQLPPSSWVLAARQNQRRTDALRTSYATRKNDLISSSTSGCRAAGFSAC